MALPRVSLLGDVDGGVALLLGAGATALDASEGSLPTGGIQ